MEDHQLTEAQLDAIATKAAEKALQLDYAEVGRSVLTKLAWLVGLATIGLVIFLSAKDAIPK